MSEAIKCDGCGEIIDTEREKFITLEVDTSEFDMSNWDSPVEAKKLHFHMIMSNKEENKKNCLDKISAGSLKHKVEA